MDHINLDFSGLSKQFSKKELWLAIKNQYFDSKILNIILVIFGIPTAGMIIITLSMVAYSILWTFFLQSVPMTVRFVFLLLCAIACVWGLVYLAKRLFVHFITRSLRMQAFATDNKLTYLHGNITDESGVLFTRGHSRVFNGGFRFPGAGRLEIANYSYTEGSGKSSHTYTHGIIRCDVSRQLPNVLLDATSNNFMGRFSNLGHFSKDQRVELEGDFNKYFTVYCPEGYTTDTLYWLTPELMQLLKERMTNYDIEVIDNHVYAYAPHTFTFNEPAIREALQLGEWLRAEFEQNTRRYADARVASPAANTVAAPGRRLKQKFSWIGVAVILFYLLPQIISFIVSIIRSAST